MVSKSKKENAGKIKKIKVLNLKKETVKDLTDDESKGVKGGDSYVYPVYHTLDAQSVMSSGALRSRGGLSGSAPVSG